MDHTRQPFSTMDPIGDCPLAREAAAVLQQNPEATDTEIADAVNQWWQRLPASEERIVTTTQVGHIRRMLQIPPTWRRPFQKRLFTP